MKIIESDVLKELATQSGATANELSSKLISELIRKQIIEDVSDIYGNTIADAINRDITIMEIIDVIRAIGIDIVKSVHLDALLECILIGDGDCPECGGEMEVTDGQYKQIGGFDYDNEPEYATILEETTCTHCGHKESNELSY